MDLKSIPEYANYLVDNAGNVYRKKKYELRVLKPYLNKKGYLSVKLSKDGVCKNFFIHTLVLLAFVGEKPFEGAECRHVDDNKLNNSVGNLVWGTHKEIYEDAVKFGKRLVNSNNVQLKKLTLHEIKEIQDNTELSKAKLGRKYKVSASTIKRIKEKSYKSYQKKYLGAISCSFF